MLLAAPQASEPSASFVTAGSDAADDGDSTGGAVATAPPPAPDQAPAADLAPAPDLALGGEDRPLLARGEPS